MQSFGELPGMRIQDESNLTRQGWIQIEDFMGTFNTFIHLNPLLPRIIKTKAVSNTANSNDGINPYIQCVIHSPSSILIWTRITE